MNPVIEIPHVVIESRVRRDTMRIHGGLMMQRNCTGMINRIKRCLGGSFVALCMLLPATVFAQVTFGTATVGDISLEVGQRLNPRELPSAAGGVTPYTYDFQGVLADGLVFNDATKVLSGRPTEAQAETEYTWTVTDSASSVTTASLTFNITVTAASTLKISEVVSGDTSLMIKWPGLQSSESYCFKVKKVSDATYPACGTSITYSGNAEDLQTHTITGLERGTHYSLILEAYNSASVLVSTRTFTASTLFDTDPIFTAQDQIGGIAIRAGRYYESSAPFPEARRGNPPITYSITPALPAGLTFNATSRKIQGIATTAQNARAYKYIATDADEDTAEILFSIAITGAITIPSLVTTVQDSAIAVQWGAVSGATSYTVSHRRYGRTSAFPTTTAITTTSETITGLNNDTLYEIRVTAFNAQSRQITFADILGRPGFATTVTDLSFVATRGDGEITIRWRSVVGAQNYLIQYHEGTGNRSFNTGEVITAMPTNGHVIDNLRPGTTYTVRIMARGANNAVIVTDTDTATTIADSAPTFGTNVITPNEFTLHVGLEFTSISGAFPRPTSGTGNKPFRYSFTPSLPPGLSFDADTHRLTGTPTRSNASTGMYTFTVTDRQGDNASLTFSLSFESFFSRTARSTNVQEIESVFSDINGKMAEDRVIPNQLAVEPRDVSYRLDPTSARIFKVSAGLGNTKPPILGMQEGKRLDYEEGPRRHDVTIYATTQVDSVEVEIGYYVVVVYVQDVNEAPQRRIEPRSGEPDQDIYFIGSGTRSLSVASQYFDPEGATVSVDADTLEITNRDGTGTYATGTNASTLTNDLEHLVTATVVNNSVVNLSIDASRITTSRSITNVVKVKLEDSGGRQTSDYYVVHVNVKIGANTPPIFVAGATGLSFTVPENTTAIGTTYAYDIDDSLRTDGSHNDLLKFSLAGATRQSFYEHDILVRNGACLYVETKRDMANKRWTAEIAAVDASTTVGASHCKPGFDFEAGVSPTFTLTVADGFGGVASATAVVQVTNVDEPPIEDSTLSKNIRVSIGGSATVDLNAYVQDPERLALDFTASPRNRTISTVTLSDAGILTIQGLRRGQTDISVTYVDQGSNTGSLVFRVIVSDPGSNNPPSFGDGVVSANYTVNEDATAGTKVGTPLVATDADSNEELKYRIDGFTDVFELSSNPSEIGQILLKAGANLDFETKTSYVFYLIVEDVWGATDSVEVTVNVGNVNEAPAANPTNTTNGRIPGITAWLNTARVFDFSKYFSDPDSFDAGRLRFRATVNQNTVVDVSTNARGMIQLTGKALGSTEAQITATDRGGLEFTLGTTITVQANRDPVVANPIGTVSMEVSEFLDLNISNVFSDSDGTVTINSAIPEDETVVLAILSQDALQLTLFGVSAGVTQVTLVAVDGVGSEVDHTFVVSVTAPATSSGKPRFALQIDDQVVTAGEDFFVALNDSSSSLDAYDIENILVKSLDSSIATGEVSGDAGELILRGYEPGNVLMQVVVQLEDGRRTGDMFTTYVETMPEVVAALPDVLLEVGGASSGLDFEHLFIDRDGDPLTYHVEVMEPSLVELEWAGTELNLTPQRQGETMVIVSASDPKLRIATVSFSVKVGDEGLRLAAEKSLANYGRTVLSGISDAVGSRVIQDNVNADLSLSQWLENYVTQSSGTSQSDHLKLSTQNRDTANALGLRSSPMGELHKPQSFALGFGGEQSGWAIWSQTDRQVLEDNSTSLETSSRFIGLDVQYDERWLVGVAVAQNRAETEFGFGTAHRQLKIESDLIVPYTSFQLAHDTRIWTMIGLGRGHVGISDQNDSIEQGSLATKLWLVGGRQELFQYRNLEFALRGDYAQVDLTSEGESGLASGLESNINRIRAGVETQIEFDTRFGSIGPFIDIGVRRDAGVNPLGTGLELASGLRWKSEAFNLEARYRTVDQPNSVTQSSASLSFQLNPKSDGSGFSMKLEPRWGVLSDSNSLTFANQPSFNNVEGLLTTQAGGSESVTLEFGYGMRVVRDKFLVRPFMQYENRELALEQKMLGVKVARSVDKSRVFQIELALGAMSHLVTEQSGGVFSTSARLEF